MGSLFWTIQVDVDGHLRIGTLRVKARVEALGNPRFADHGAPVHQGVHAVLHPRWSQITLSKSRPRRPRASLRSDMAMAWLRVLRLSPTTSSLSIPVTNSNSCNNLHRATSRCPGSCNTFKLRALRSDLLSAPQDQLQSPRLGRCSPAHEIAMDLLTLLLFKTIRTGCWGASVSVRRSRFDTFPLFFHHSLFGVLVYPFEFLLAPVPQLHVDEAVLRTRKQPQSTSK